ncbi:hypothetical protein OESDEN_18382, partial [Oesophagostomum dentatum]
MAHVDCTRGQHAEIGFITTSQTTHGELMQDELEGYSWMHHLDRKKFKTEDEVRKALCDFFKAQPPIFW